MYSALVIMGRETKGRGLVMYGSIESIIILISNGIKFKYLLDKNGIGVIR